METTLTQPANTAQPVITYWINSPVSDAVAKVVAELQAALAGRFPDSIWMMPRESLHISFNALSPTFESDSIPNAPQDVPPTYVNALRELLVGIAPIELHFDTVEAFPAAIILKAHDNGAYKQLRDQFNERVELPAGTKVTPNIIHTTICRFHKAIDIEDVKDFLSTKTVKIDMTVSEFRTVREKILYMIDCDILQRISLTNDR